MTFSNQCDISFGTKIKKLYLTFDEGYEAGLCLPWGGAQDHPLL